jgi:hypothetical protein
MSKVKNKTKIVNNIVWVLLAIVEVSIIYRYVNHIDNIYLKNLHKLYLVYLWIAISWICLAILATTVSITKPETIKNSDPKKVISSLSDILKVTWFVIAKRIVDTLVVLVVGVIGVWHFFVPMLLVNLFYLLLLSRLRTLHSTILKQHPQISVDDLESNKEKKAVSKFKVMADI